MPCMALVMHDIGRYTYGRISIINSVARYISKFSRHRLDCYVVPGTVLEYTCTAVLVLNRSYLAIIAPDACTVPTMHEVLVNNNFIILNLVP
eukprot:SAG22_NODE_410_length_10907_cov_2.597520_2_plen_92_part_00